MVLVYWHSFFITFRKCFVYLSSVFAWTDSMIVLGWLVGNPRRFKTYVRNRVSHTVELIPLDQRNHVNRTNNPADCASRGLFPSELLGHKLWWNGQTWLKSPPSNWPLMTISLQMNPQRRSGSSAIMKLLIKLHL